MTSTYTSCFVVSDTYIDQEGTKFLCTSPNDFGGEASFVIPAAFLEAYNIKEGTQFTCDVDYGGGIVLESIVVVKDVK